MNKQAKPPSERAGGRPRSEKTRQTILSAALDLAKNEAVQTVTIEAIARTAGVSKATIYRWWDFGQLTFNLSERLRLTAGARYPNENSRKRLFGVG